MIARVHLKREPSAFTLLEMMLAVAVLALLMLLISQVIGGTQKVIKLVTGQLQAFQEARIAYETLTGKLRQATLNIYWDYNNPVTPTTYQRSSELQFLCGPTTITPTPTPAPIYASLFTAQNPTHCLFFEAPLGYSQSTSNSGLQNLLNSCGYYIQFGSDVSLLPSFLSSTRQRWRFRLMQWQPPTENLGIYQYTNANPSYDLTSWINLTTTGAVRPLADNVVALVVLPKLSSSEDPTGSQLTSNYYYDSRLGITSTPQLLTTNQLPPLVQVVMVAIDEASATQLATKYGTTMPPLFPTTNPLFQSSSNTQLQADLTTFEAILSATPGNAAGNTIPLHYEVWNSTVVIRSSKWSSTP